MREIKFRGKSHLNNEWVFGDLEYQRSSKTALIHTYKENGLYNGQREVKEETIGQFTSLRDINGKDIYEGDILEVNYADDESYLEVRFVRGVFAFLWNGDLDDEFPCNAPTHEWARIVGNIYDNPELLNGTS